MVAWHNFRFCYVLKQLLKKTKKYPLYIFIGLFTFLLKVDTHHFFETVYDGLKNYANQSKLVRNEPLIAMEMLMARRCMLLPERVFSCVCHVSVSLSIRGKSVSIPQLWHVILLLTIHLPTINISYGFTAHS